MNSEEYYQKLSGAVIGRFAGCCLGAAVELMGYKRTMDFASSINFEMPPDYYWPESPFGERKRYLNGTFNEFTSERMKYLPADDDIIYTLIGMLILEEYGKNFTTENVAEIWQKLLPVECTFTAERIALKNLKEGISPYKTGEYNNPDNELIGAAIRSDIWGYVNPGDPTNAANMAYRDAYLTHRNSGLHSAVYFAAVISLAFISNSLIEVFNEALNYIPSDSYFAQQMKWALSVSDEISDYKDAYSTVTKKFPEMDPVHSINNACLVIWGSLIGENDFSKGISHTVAMCYDNDCTAATVGSILGAYLGIGSIGDKWYKPWNNKIKSYLIGYSEFNIEDVIFRINSIAQK